MPTGSQNAARSGAGRLRRGLWAAYAAFAGALLIAALALWLSAPAALPLLSPDAAASDADFAETAEAAVAAVEAALPFAADRLADRALLDFEMAAEALLAADADRVARVTSFNAAITSFHAAYRRAVLLLLAIALAGLAAGLWALCRPGLLPASLLPAIPLVTTPVATEPLIGADNSDLLLPALPLLALGAAALLGQIVAKLRGRHPAPAPTAPSREPEPAAAVSDGVEARIAAALAEVGPRRQSLALTDLARALTEAGALARAEAVVDRMPAADVACRGYLALATAHLKAGDRARALALAARTVERSAEIVEDPDGLSGGDDPSSIVAAAAELSADAGDFERALAVAEAVPELSRRIDAVSNLYRRHRLDSRDAAAAPNDLARLRAFFAECRAALDGLGVRYDARRRDVALKGMAEHQARFGEIERALADAEAIADEALRDLAYLLMARERARLGDVLAASGIAERVVRPQNREAAHLAIVQFELGNADIDAALAAARRLPTPAGRDRAVESIVRFLAERGQLRRALAAAGFLKVPEAKAAAARLIEAAQRRGEGE